MKISFENRDKVSGLITVSVEEADYSEGVKKALKDYRKVANIPGFRPGKVPLSMIERQFGTAAKGDEINKVVDKQLHEYLEANGIKILGEPLQTEDAEEVDLKSAPPYTFKFDIALEPEFKVELTAGDEIDYYSVRIDEELINDQVEMYTSRSGHYDKVEEYAPKDMIRCDLRELDEAGNPKEGGIVVEGAVMLPDYIKEEDQKKRFAGAKVGDIITFNPKRSYPDSDVDVSSLLKIDKEQVADMDSDFSCQITEISRYQKAPVDQELFDTVFGKDVVKDEEGFRAKIAEGLRSQYEMEADLKFIRDVRKYVEEKVGELEYPEALMKRIMLKNSKDKGNDYVEKNYAASIKELSWHLMKEQLIGANNVKVEDGDMRESAREFTRAQFAQYGMSNVPEEYIMNYAESMLKNVEYTDYLIDRTLDRKLTEALKKVVKLNHKAISLRDFNKMVEVE